MRRVRLCLMATADLGALLALMPFAEHLGLVLEEATPDRVVARLDWAPHHCHRPDRPA
jgi:acyl-coenzyme A thioesterase PaaI-like protein